MQAILKLQAHKVDHKYEPIFIQFHDYRPDNYRLLITLTQNVSINVLGIPFEDYEYTLDIDALYWEKYTTHTRDQMGEILGYQLFSGLKNTDRYALMLVYGVEQVLAKHGTPRPISPENSVIARERQQNCQNVGALYRQISFYS